MKLVLSIFIFSLVISASYARNDYDLNKFNTQMQENIQNVVDYNPEKYESRPMRMPASVQEPIQENKDPYEYEQRKNMHKDDLGLQGW